MTFSQKLDFIIKKNNSLLCVGLDPEFEKLPEKFKSLKNPQFEFNKWIIDQTHEFVCVYKLNSAFYESQGNTGLEDLEKTIKYIHSTYTDIPVILDAKRGDIGNTVAQYVKEVFEVFQADAVTVNPYGGFDTIEPFLSPKEKGVIIWCRSSNPGASDFQDVIDKETGLTIYELVAKKAAEKNINKNIGLVVGATYPEQMKKLRELVGNEIIFLVPGLGAQGGKPEDLPNGFTKDKKGVIASSSRGIIFAENPREETQKLRDEINKYRT